MFLGFLSGGIALPQTTSSTWRRDSLSWICCHYSNFLEIDALSFHLLREFQGVDFPLSPCWPYPTVSQPARAAIRKFHRCGWLKQQTFTFRSSRSWEFQDQGARWGLFSWSAHSHLLAVSSHGGERGREESYPSSSGKGTILIMGVPTVSPQLNLMTSKRPSSQCHHIGD